MIQMLKSVKGFIGPIGDDLPSLVPLLLALVIFFSTFTFSWQVFESRNTGFESDLGALRIARVLKSNSYIASVDEFNDLCDSLIVSDLHFRAGLSDEATNTETGFQGFALKTLKFVDLDGEESTTDDVFVCSNSEENFSDEKFVEGKNFLVKIYPVVLEQDKIVKPMHLIVVIWQ